MNYNKPGEAMTLTNLTETPPSLGEAQKAVGGLVELVTIYPAGTLLGQLLVNEEARIYNLPINEAASVLAGVTIHGCVLLLRGEAMWGNDIEDLKCELCGSTEEVKTRLGKHEHCQECHERLNELDDAAKDEQKHWWVPKAEL